MGYPHYASECAQHHDLVRDFNGARPEIWVLCGSTRFYDEFYNQNLRLTLEGKIVLSLGCDTKSDDDMFGVDDVQALKERLDELHKRKIDLADCVYVININGYIGSSTASEIAYAEKIGKPVVYHVS